MKVLFIIEVVLIAILLALKVQIRTNTADAQATPTATASPTAGGACTITGNVVNADTTPLVNGTITFNSQRVQVVGSTVVNPTYVTTNTDSGGNIRAFQMPMGVVAQVTICPPATGQGQSASCAAPFSVIIPFTNTADFGDIAQGTNLTGASTLALTTLQVTGTLTYPDGSVYTAAGHNSMAALGVGVPAPTTPAGQLLTIEKDFDGDVIGAIWNHGPATDTNARAGLWLNAGENITNTWIFQTGPQYTSSPLVPTGSTMIYGDGGLDLISGRADPIIIGINTAKIAYFQYGTPSLVLTNNNSTALTFGSATLTSVGGPNYNLMSGAHYDGANWIADTASVSTLQNSTPGATGWYRLPSGTTITVGQPLPAWIEEARMTNNAFEFDHISNDVNAGVPTVTGGTLADGSRDSFGWITGVTDGATITFSRPFVGTTVCTANDAGQPLLWYLAAQGPSAVTFKCVVPWTGAPCTGGQGWVEYHCMGTYG